MSDAHLLPGSWYSSSGDPASFLGVEAYLPKAGRRDPGQIGSWLSPELVGGEVSYFTEKNLHQFPLGTRPQTSQNFHQQRPSEPGRLKQNVLPGCGSQASC